ncbi:uncharacterized protein [Battus philenor]|uniref:uncharacterized protein n=1 Tax=Battus philenor TaxID=42288 RepID=UPI0035CF7C10
MNIDFEKIFRIMVFAMRVNRSHPDIPRDKKWILQVMLMHGIFSLIFCLLAYSIIYHDLQNKDFTQACSSGVLCVIFSVVTFKYCIMVWYQKLFRNMIEIMKRDYKLSLKLPMDEQDIILKYAIKGRAVIKLWLWVAICTAGLFIVKANAYMIYYKITGQFELVHLYELTYPSMIEEIKYEPGPFVAIYLAFLFFDIYAVFMYIAFAPLGPILMLHTCGQLEIVKVRLLKIFPKKRIDPEKTRRELKEIVKYLQKIYSLVDNIKDSLKLLYELILKATIIILPISFYQVVQTYHNGQISLEFISVIFGAITISGVPCYYSDMLQEMGENVRLSVYTSGWEKSWDRQTRLTLQLVLMRATRPVAVTTMFHTLCLETVTSTYQQAYALFNLLNAVWN